MSWRSHSGAVAVTGCLILALVIARPISARAQSQESIRVFVIAGDGSTDFVDPDAKASAEDVKKAFRGRKDILVVEPAVSSDLVVRVLRRFRGQSGRSVAIATSPTTAVAAPILERVVVATLNVGEFTHEINGAHTRSWGAAAGQLVDHIEKWVRDEQGANPGTPEMRSGLRCLTTAWSRRARRTV